MVIKKIIQSIADYGVKHILKYDPPRFDMVTTDTSELADPTDNEQIPEQPRTPVEVCIALAQDPCVDIRSTAATNPPMSTEALWRLSDPDADIRDWVDEHPDISTDDLVALSEDDDYLARRKAAFHPRTPSDVLTRLAADEDEGVRRGVAENISTPTHILTLLTEDEDSRVAQVANDSLKTRAQPTLLWGMKF